MTGPAIASRVVGPIRMTAESHRGRVVRKNVMIALSKAEGKHIFFRFATGTDSYGCALYGYTPFCNETSKPDHQHLLRTLLRPPRPSHGIAHQPSLTYCRFHSSADIGSAL